MLMHGYQAAGSAQCAVSWCSIHAPFVARYASSLEAHQWSTGDLTAVQGLSTALAVILPLVVELQLGQGSRGCSDAAVQTAAGGGEGQAGGGG